MFEQLLLPQTTRAGGPGGRVVRVPNFGAGRDLTWSQVSSVWTPRGKQAVVLLDPTPGLADAILSEVTDSQLLGKPAVESEARAIWDAMRTDHGGALRTPGTFNAERERVRERDIREFISMSREFVTTPETQEKDRQRTESVIREVQRLLLIGAVVLAEMLAVRYLLPQGISLAALTLLHQDNFGGYTGNPNGQTMSDGVGTWAVDAGTWNVTALAICECNSSGDSYMRDSAASAVDIQRTFIKWRNAAAGANGGPQTRHVFSGGQTSCFQNYKKSDHYLDMYRVVNDAYTLIGSDRTVALSGGDVFWMGSNGTAQTGGVNGFGSEVTRISVTDSNNATGVGGVYGDVTTFDYSNFEYYTDSGGGGGAVIPVFMHQYRRRWA